MDELRFDVFQEILAKRLSWRAALTGIAGGGAAAALALAGSGRARSVRAIASPVATPAAATPAASPGVAGAAPGGAEILWDTWGVPHIYAADVLAAWDPQAEAANSGTSLFAFWVQAMAPTDFRMVSDLFVTPWDPADPLNTPRGLKEPEKAVQALSAAAAQVDALFGRLDLPWGDVGRLRRGSVDLPANGFPSDPLGVFHALAFDFSTLETTKQVNAFGGDAYVAAVEFGDPVRAFVLTTAGNASQPGSPHVGDQLTVPAKGELRPAWLTRMEVEANLEARDERG